MSLIVAPILGLKVGSLIDRRWASKKLARGKAEVARKAKEDEARSLIARLLEIRRSSVERAAHMAELPHNARAWLRQAEEEFSDSAFGPFWEAVQHSAVCLAQFCANGQGLLSQPTPVRQEENERS